MGRYVQRERRCNIFGKTGGSCFPTTMVFCRLLRDFDIPCREEVVQTLIGNNKSAEILFTKGKDALDAEANKHLKDDPVNPNDAHLMGHGWSEGTEHFHFLMNLPRHKEVVDLTLEGLDRPQWGINCKNYWAKYDVEAEKKDFFIGEDVWVRSKCVLFSRRKTGEKGKPVAELRCDMKELDKDYHDFREWVKDRVEKRKIPIFMER